MVNGCPKATVDCLGVTLRQILTRELLKKSPQVTPKHFCTSTAKSQQCVILSSKKEYKKNLIIHLFYQNIGYLDTLHCRGAVPPTIAPRFYAIEM